MQGMWGRWGGGKKDGAHSNNHGKKKNTYPKNFAPAGPISRILEPSASPSMSGGA